MSEGGCRPRVAWDASSVETQLNNVLGLNVGVDLPHFKKGIIVIVVSTEARGTCLVPTRLWFVVSTC